MAQNLPLAANSETLCAEDPNAFFNEETETWPFEDDDGAESEYDQASAEDLIAFFNEETGTWRCKDDDGAEFEYDEAKKKWIPLLDEELVKSQQAIYSVAGVDEEANPSTPAAPILAQERRKDEYDPSQHRGKGVAISSSSTKLPKPLKNRAVHVTNLPLDTNVDELYESFATFGPIEKDDDGSPKITMYTSEDGSFNGQALVVFFKENTVAVAVNLMNGTELRLGDISTRIRVRKALFSHKKSGGDGSNGQPSAPRKTVGKKKVSKQRRDKADEGPFSGKNYELIRSILDDPDVPKPWLPVFTRFLSRIHSSLPSSDPVVSPST